jgi:hypothetical protein
MLDELHAWMLEHKVTRVTVEGITLVLADWAIPMPVEPRPPNTKEPGWDDLDEELTPQQRIRQRYADEANPDKQRAAK